MTRRFLLSAAAMLGCSSTSVSTDAGDDLRADLAFTPDADAAIDAPESASDLPIPIDLPEDVDAAVGPDAMDVPEAEASCGAARLLDVFTPLADVTIPLAPRRSTRRVFTLRGLTIHRLLPGLRTMGDAAGLGATPVAASGHEGLGRIGARDALNVSAGVGFLCEASSPLGRTDCWGRNDAGQLGRGGFSVVEPRTVFSLFDNLEDVVSGTTISCALRQSVTSCWGFPPGVPGFSYPRVIAGPAFVRLWATARANHLCGTTAAGEVYCYGVNLAGETGGDPSCEPFSRSFQRVAGVGEVVAVSMAEGVTLAVRRDGTLWCWGRCTQPDGDAVPGTAWIARQIPLPTVGPISDVTTAVQPHAVTCVLEGRGFVHCWGSCASLALGFSCESGAALGGPRRLVAPEFAIDLDTSGTHTCVTTMSSTLLCWGDNSTRAVDPTSAAEIVVAPRQYLPPVTP